MAGRDDSYEEMTLDIGLSATWLLSGNINPLSLSLRRLSFQFCWLLWLQYRHGTTTTEALKTLYKEVRYYFSSASSELTCQDMHVRDLFRALRPGMKAYPAALLKCCPRGASQREVTETVWAWKDLFRQRGGGTKQTEQADSMSRGTPVISTVC